MTRSIIIISIVLSYLTSYGQERIARVMPQNKVIVSFGNKLWNKDPRKIESAFVVLKDNTSKKYILLELLETAPDSSIFRTIYKLNLSNKRLVPSVYIPDQNLVASDEGKREVLKRIKKDELPRNPYLYVKNIYGSQVLDIFDSREKAKRALKAYKKRKALSDVEKFLSEENILDKKGLENIKEKELSDRLKQVLLSEKQNEQKRKELYINEFKRIKKLKDNFDSLRQENKNQNISEASSVYTEALELSSRGEHSEALTKFTNAYSLNPYNNNIYYAYATSLFNNERYNDAIVSFRILDDEKFNDLERKYYLGISHYKQSEFQAASELFNEVKQGDNKNLGASSAFYLGLIDFQKENFGVAEKEFQYVLDFSFDPKLDERAEAYIELILKAKQYDKALDKPYFLRASFGTNYDSNILLQSDNTSANASASDEAGQRMILTSSLERKFIYNPKKDFSLKSNFTTIYSFDQEEHKAADPTLFSLSTPYSSKAEAFDTNFRLNIEPGLEFLFMDLNDEGKEQILTSFFLKNKNQVVKSSDRVVSYNLEYYLNQADIEGASGDQDSSSNRFEFTYNSLHFLNKKRGEVLSWNLSLTTNQAKGKNFTYNRIEASASYILPFPDLDSVFNTNLKTYYAQYDSDNERKDQQYSLTLNWIKKLNDQYNLIANSGYASNLSNIENNEYDRYFVGLILSGSWNF